MALSLLRRKRKRPRRADSPSPVPLPILSVHPPQAEHPPTDTTLLTPSPVRRALAYGSDAHGDDYVEELDDSYYAEPVTPPSCAEENDEDVPPEDEDLLSRLLRREREYTRLQVYYEELHRRYADSKDQIAHLNRQVDALAGRLERKEQRIRFLKLIVGHK